MTYEAEALKIGRTDDLRIKLLAKSRLGAQCTIEHRPLLHGASHGTMRQPCAASRRLAPPRGFTRHTCCTTSVLISTLRSMKLRRAIFAVVAVFQYCVGGCVECWVLSAELGGVGGGG